jgi:3'-5' exoribonuclease
LNSDTLPQHLFIKDINEETDIKGCYLAKNKRLGTTRVGKPFINLILADRTGELEAKVWDNADRLSSLFRDGDIIEVTGRASAYRGHMQITVTNIKTPAVVEADPALFLESAPGDLSEMMKFLRTILRGVSDKHLRALNDRFMTDTHFVSQFKKAPAAKNFHHGYLGGLLEHTLSVCRMACQVADHYPQLDRDLLITASFLHDIGKVREYSWNLHIDYTDEGRLLGHLMLGVAMVDEKLRDLKSFPHELALKLRHMILSHHGEYEFGSPKRPKFLEAFALHLLDDLDAKINGLGRFMERDRQDGSWTDYNRLFDRYFLKGEIRSIEEGSGSSASGDGVNNRQWTLFSPGPDR